MTAPTRYTVDRRPDGDVLELLVAALLRQPATWVCAGVYVLVRYGAHAASNASLTAACLMGAAVLTVSMYRRHLWIVARLQRTLRDTGLVFRDESGVVHAPRRRGFVRRHGRNLHVRWSLPPGMALSDVLTRQEAIEQRCVCELACWMEEGLLCMDVMRHRIPRHVAFSSFYGAARPFGRCLVGLGRGRRGALWVDLAALPHLLVGGQTGGGKSVFLRQALTGLALSQSPRHLRIQVIDLKGGVELAPYAELPHSLGPVADSIDAAAQALEKIRRELDDRLGDLRGAGVHDIDAWNEDPSRHAQPRILVVVDELAELTVRQLGDDRAGRAAQQAALGRLTEIARLGRSVGIHLILSTQRPDADAVPGQLKANLPGTVAFRVRSSVNSVILIDSDRAAKLGRIDGRGLWCCERVEEFQGVYVSREESERLLAEGWGAADPDGPSALVTRWGQSPGFDASKSADDGQDLDSEG